MVVLGLVDDMRKHVFYHHIKPAIDRGLKSITLRASDAHSELHLRNRVPAVCSVLGCGRARDTSRRLARSIFVDTRVPRIHAMLPRYFSARFFAALRAYLRSSARALS